MKQVILFVSSGLILILAGSFTITSGAFIQGTWLAFTGCVSLGASILAYRKASLSTLEKCIAAGSSCLGFVGYAAILLLHYHPVASALSTVWAGIAGWLFVLHLRKLRQ